LHQDRGTDGTHGELVPSLCCWQLLAAEAAEAAAVRSSRSSIRKAAGTWHR